MQALTLTTAFVAAILLVVALQVVLTRRRRPEPLPREWQLMLRPVFSANEQRMYQQLREAFPEHIILCKLALARFTHASEPARVNYWHGLIGPLHVTFAISNAKGRVLAAIDVEGPRGGSRRATRIKIGVLSACRVRYLCFMVDDLPSTDELRRAVLHDDAAPDTRPQAIESMPSHKLDEARSSLHSAIRKQREHRDSLQSADSRLSHDDSRLAPDSFFAPDSRQDGSFDSSGFAPLRAKAFDHQIAGVVIEDSTPPERRA